MISRLLVAAIALAALLVAPEATAALIVVGCAVGGAWALRADQVPAADAIADALDRSRSVVGELETPGAFSSGFSVREIDG